MSQVTVSVIYKCHKLLSLLYTNVTNTTSVHQMSQVTKRLIYKCHMLLSVLYTNVTSY